MNNYKKLYNKIKTHINYIKGGSSLSQLVLEFTHIDERMRRIKEVENTKYINEIEEINQSYINLSNFIKSISESESEVYIFSPKDHKKLIESLSSNKYIIRELAIMLRFAFFTDFFNFYINQYTNLQKFIQQCNLIASKLNELLDDEQPSLILAPGNSPYKILFCLELLQDLKPHKLLIFPLSGVHHDETLLMNNNTSLDRFYKYLFLKNNIRLSNFSKIIFFDYFWFGRTFIRTVKALKNLTRHTSNPINDENILLLNIHDYFKASSGNPDHDWINNYLFGNYGDRCQPKYLVGDLVSGESDVQEGIIVSKEDNITHLSKEDCFQCNIALLAILVFIKYNDELSEHTSYIYSDFIHQIDLRGIPLVPISYFRGISANPPHSGIFYITYFDIKSTKTKDSFSLLILRDSCTQQYENACIEVYDLCYFEESTLNPTLIIPRNIIRLQHFIVDEEFSIYNSKDKLPENLNSRFFKITFIALDQHRTIENCILDELLPNFLKIFIPPYSQQNIIFISYLAILDIQIEEQAPKINLKYCFENPKYCSTVLKTCSTLLIPPHTPEEKLDFLSKLEECYRKSVDISLLLENRKIIYRLISNIDLAITEPYADKEILYYEKALDGDQISVIPVTVLCVNDDCSSIVMQTIERVIIKKNWSLSTLEPLQFVLCFEKKDHLDLSSESHIDEISDHSSNANAVETNQVAKSCMESCTISGGLIL